MSGSKDSPASPRLQGPPTPFSEERAQRRDRRTLRVSIAAALALWVVAGLNAAGTVTLEIRPGEGAGWNPALDFVVLGLIALLLPYGIVRARHVRAVEGIERRLPDFLGDVAESGSQGLTLPDAIRTAARGQYGPLTPEIRRMATELNWGIPAEEVLAGLEQRLSTPLVKEAFAVVGRAQATGGRYPEVLRRVAHDLRSTQLMRERRRDMMRTYVIVVALAYAVFLLTVYVLAAVYLPELLAAGASSGFGSTGYLVGTAVVASLFLALFVAVIAHGVGDGLVAGFLYRGRFAEGLTLSAGLLMVGWVVLRFVVAPIAGGA